MKISIAGFKRTSYFSACIVLLGLMAALSGLAPSAASAATPDQFAGLNMWVKADTGVTVTGGVVTGLVEQSSNKIPFTPYTDVNTVSNVTVVDSAINGHPALHFDGLSALVGHPLPPPRFGMSY